MTTEPVVRAARPADARALAELRWTFKQEDFAGRVPTPARDVEEAERWIRDRLGDGRWLARVAESEGRIRGHVFLCPVERMPEPYEDNDPVGYVPNFFVMPSHRNKGVGSALLTALQEHAGGAGPTV
ncbi:GNAT family N-acetyltransferase [Streptomyces erythrochromogenes]|uniref:GNAT family N-acetyltransferase n=1 Tax=Streptomyces erythrochromogenes TaxID=285574 RepID=UPI00382DB6D9